MLSDSEILISEQKRKPKLVVENKKRTYPNNDLLTILFVLYF